MEPQIILFRFAITFVLSFLYGLERQRAHKPTGFGTFIFVAVGSCGLAITAMTMNTDNPLSLLSAIVTGIGFLGAGALIKTTDKIFGFTTAASIWVFAIFGLIIGVGDYLVGMIIYALVWVIILSDNYLEKKGIGSYQRKILITTNRIMNEKDVREQLLCDRKDNDNNISHRRDKRGHKQDTPEAVQQGLVPVMQGGLSRLYDEKRRKRMISP
ncbi:MAG: MgtC/SapB family protein [Candidatus Woesearchaeota archaeon]|nr:MgtC/SapB family protein [Candidatus Woesearchaeota archaeon]